MRFEQLSPARNINTELRILRQVAYKALTRYGIQPSSIRLLQYEDNAVYSVITEKSRYVLRISADGHPVEYQRSELVWLDALADEPGLQTPRPIKTLAGELLVEIPVSDGVNRVCVLFEWIYGTAAPSYMTGAQAMMCGRATALLHAQSLHFVPSPPFMRPSLGWDELCGPLAAWRREEALARLEKSDINVLEQIADKIGMQLSVLSVSSSQRALIHADLHRGNIVINKDSVGVIDFDDCAYSYLMLDVATMLSSLYRISSPKHYKLVRHAYLSGYAAVRKLPDELEEMLLIFLVMRDLIIVNFIAGTHNAHILSWGPHRLEGILLQLKNYLRSGTYAGDFSGHDEL